MDSEYKWYGEINKDFLTKDYLLPTETLSERVSVIGDTASRILKDPTFKNRFEHYMKSGWLSLSSPIWSNFGRNRGLPISCYGSSVEDSMDSILETNAEIGMMTKLGGGTSLYLGNLRGRGSPIKDNGFSSGAVHFASLTESIVKTISQGSTRRGSCAVYLDAEHPDILEFLKIKSDGFFIQQLSFGVCLSDEFMNSLIAGNENNRNIWARIIEVKRNTGYPYIIFTGNANKNKPKVYIDNNLEITHSNLCTEIFLPDNSDWSFVCDLASVNLLYYKYWKNTNFVFDVISLLDAVGTEFIIKAKKIKFMKKAVAFFEANRALGLGVLGWHSYLQSNMIAFESYEAMKENASIFKQLKNECDFATKELCRRYGSTPLLKPYGVRNATTMAIAPTVSSSWILGGGKLSKSIEAEQSNYFVKSLAKGKYTVKNYYLDNLLTAINKNTNEVWQDILIHNGSVQHLDFLTEHQKNVFKTQDEISPMGVIQQAAQRQVYIDQGQSLNLKIHPNTAPKEISNLYLEAWKLGLKSIYYQYNVNAAQEFTRNLLSCKVCEA